jgi:hypothetical protein
MANKLKDNAVEDLQPVDGRFKLTKAKIREMYKDDKSIRHNVNKTVSDSSTVGSLTDTSLRSGYFNIDATLERQREYSRQAYTFYPVYSNIVDYLSNMYNWRYTFVPSLAKDKGGDYSEAYQLMADVVDGISIETTFPMVLTELFTSGAAYLLTTKNTAAKTITTLKLPYKYCRPSAISQYGTVIYQFDFSYFDSLGLSNQELEAIFEYYPKEMKSQYDAYKKDTKNLRWQMLNPKFAGAILLNETGFPNRLYSLFGILQYQQYANNELERSGQLLDKIVSHKLPTWQDKLIVDIDEMSELHQSMAKVIAKNNHVRMLSTFGDIQVHSIGEDQSKENKTMENAYNTIYDNSGLNHGLFSGESVKALECALTRDKAFVWKYVEQLVSFYNVVINNSFNFDGYQCNLSMLPITHYDAEKMLLSYKDGATLGVNKLEYIVASGVKQANLKNKLELENFLQLDQLKPLSTSYTQNDNSKKETEEKEASTSETEEVTEKEEEEVVTDEQNTK